MKVVEIVIYGDTQKAARQPHNMSNNQRKERKKLCKDDELYSNNNDNNSTRQIERVRMSAKQQWERQLLCIMPVHL